MKHVRSHNERFKNLNRKIINVQAHIVVVGLGYVGLPLAVALQRRGFPVSGVDIRHREIKKQLKEMKVSFPVHSDYSAVKDADVVVVCVPTPVDAHRVPDMNYIKDAAAGVIEYLHPETLVILESTTYPGTTREFLATPITKKGLNVGKDVFLAYCPERMDPGNTRYTIENTTRVIGGITRRCAMLARAFYSTFVKSHVHVLSSPEAAEMTKLFENIFRNVNIALVNEMALICQTMGIDIWEVIEGAATKPFGFMPFYPGPGVGGHCIPVDPFYLAYRARAFGVEARFVQLAGEVNAAMPSHVVKRCAQILNLKGKALKNSKVLVVGVAYKPDVADIRHSPSLEIMKQLLNHGTRVYYLDPFVPEVSVLQKKMRSIKNSQLKTKYFDLAVIVTPHTSIDLKRIAEVATTVLDTRGCLRKQKFSNVYFL